MKKLLSGITILIMLTGRIFQTVLAEEQVFSISDNGSESENSIQIQQQTSQTVEQHNTATITNDVTQNAQTGNNTASNNTEVEAAIQTGNSNINTTVQNENINQNSAKLEDQQTTTHVNISGNGSNSVNSIYVSQFTNIQSNQTNQALITNTIQINTETGSNNLNNNTDEESMLITGNINEETSVENNFINQLKVFIEKCEDVLTLSLFGNGADSVNRITTSFPKTHSFTQENKATLITNIFENLSTGKNTLNGNTGNVFVKTGDIKEKKRIVNKDINKAFITLVCEVCQEKKKEEEKEIEKEIVKEIKEEKKEVAPVQEIQQPTQVEQPIPTPQEQQEQEEEEEEEQVLGISEEIPTLPITGSNIYTMLLLLNTGLFGTGVFLRFLPKHRYA